MNPILIYIAIGIVLAVTLLAAARSRIFTLRQVEAYDRLPLIGSESVEGNRSLHMSYGGSAVRELSTLSAVAASEVFFTLTERAALAEREPLVTVSDPVTLALGQDTLRRAYKARQAQRKYRPALVRWFPQGAQSLPFAAGAAALSREADVSAQVLLGRFGPELVLLGESALRHDQQIIAHSDRIEGQAVAYAVSATPLLGEELYAGAGYLRRNPISIGSVVAQDVLRAVIVLLLLGLGILSLFGVTF